MERLSFHILFIYTHLYKKLNKSLSTSRWAQKAKSNNLIYNFFLNPFSAKYFYKLLPNSICENAT